MLIKSNLKAHSKHIWTLFRELCCSGCCYAWRHSCQCNFFDPIICFWISNDGTRAKLIFTLFVSHCHNQTVYFEQPFSRSGWMVLMRKRVRVSRHGNFLCHQLLSSANRMLVYVQRHNAHRWRWRQWIHKKQTTIEKIFSLANTRNKHIKITKKWVQNRNINKSNEKKMERTTGNNVLRFQELFTIH